MKNVLISGGSRGIGAACVEAFARAGYSVAFIYNKSENEAYTLARQTGAHAIKADISLPADAARAVSEAQNLLGGIDILINNAGVSHIGLFTQMTDAEWRNIIDTNLSGAFYLSREAAGEMIARHWGRIINIGSMWGKTGASCEVHYSASKAGLRGMTMALAKELGPSNITVNAIEPGVIATDMNASLDEETMRELCDETPLCRIGEPMDVANLAYFLASYEAGFITGQIIGVDGGFAV
jgi:3-oxoacyl-[acyl-carrier protein] reductase